MALVALLRALTLFVDGSMLNKTELILGGRGALSIWVPLGLEGCD